MKNYKAGDILFLTRRISKKQLYRWFISNSIAYLTKNKNQNINDVKVHSAIIFENDGILFVREMDKGGSRIIDLVEYLNIFNGRVEIVSMPFVRNKKKIKEFNEKCLNTKVKYDYANLFLFQSIRALTKKWIGTNTPYKRICSEDTQRMYNIINPIFKKVEQVNPNDLYFKLKELNIIEDERNIN